MSEKILEIKELNIRVNDKIIVRDMSFDLLRGQIVGVIGASGVGKSTMLFAISGLLGEQYTVTGDIHFDDGQNILNMNRRNLQLICAKNTNIVFQDALNSLDPYETIGSQLREIINFKEIRSFKDEKNRDKLYNKMLEDSSNLNNAKNLDNGDSRISHSESFESANKDDYIEKRIYELLDLVGLENEASILKKYP